MTKWAIEIVTNDVLCHTIEINADHVEKLSHHVISVDGVEWRLPDIAGMSFARVEELVNA